MKTVLNELGESLDAAVARFKRERVSIEHAAAYARHRSTLFEHSNRTDREHLAAFYATVARLLEPNGKDPAATA